MKLVFFFCVFLCVYANNVVFVPHRASKYDGISIIAGLGTPVEVREPLDVGYNYLVYNQNRNWATLRTLFATDIEFEISGLAIYHGIEKVDGYHMILDPDNSDTNYNLNHTIVEAYYAKGCLNPSECRDKDKFTRGESGSGHHQSYPRRNITGTSLIIFSNLIEQHSIQTNQNYTFESMLEIRVNSDMKIVWMRFTQDLLQLTRYFPALGNPNVTDICNKIQTRCKDTNQQYASFEECYTYVSSLPTFGFTLAFGKSSTCIGWHTVLSGPRPDLHCMHVGKQVISPLVTPCQNWAF